MTSSGEWPYHRLPERLADILELPEAMRTLHAAIWRDIYLAADILDDFQDGDLNGEPAQNMAPLVSILCLSRAMALVGQTVAPTAVLDLVANTLSALVQAQAWDLMPEQASKLTLMASIENRTGATMGGTVAMLGVLSGREYPSTETLGRWGHNIGAALQWRSDLDAAAEAGPTSHRWKLLEKSTAGLGLDLPAPAGLVLAAIRLRILQLQANVLYEMTGSEPRGLREAFEEAFDVALDLRLAERRLSRFA
ncbi:MAG: class 1 isoprenoid biosynthesis enzyme [Candidatus Sericytochromatia bacterium]|nr:class 1 isoprenoid biosynthesis enzyme [Candidatus Sericytochromatia bacterium]